jgi:hypothetical protein
MRLNRLALIPVYVLGAALGSLYLYQAFLGPGPTMRVALRTIPILPLAVWTLWFDAARPFQTAPESARIVGRVFLLLAVMGLALLVLGIGLNQLYDPGSVSART